MADTPFVRSNRLILGKKIVGEAGAAENKERIKQIKKRTVKLGSAVLNGYARKVPDNAGAAELARREAAEREAANGSGATMVATGSITVEEIPDFLDTNPHMAVEVARAELSRVPKPRKGALDALVRFLDRDSFRPGNEDLIAALNAALG